MAKLITTVHLHTAEGTVVYGPGDEVSEAHAALISAPGVWADKDGATVTAPVTHAAPEVEKSTADVSTEPPRNGKGSSNAAWVAYARTLGIEVADDAKKGDVIVLVEAHKATTQNDDGETAPAVNTDGEPSRDPEADLVDEWVEYAEKLGIEVPDDADTADIIVLVDALK